MKALVSDCTTLLGKLTFQVVVPYDGSTPAPVQQLDVKIPITVVEHDAHIQKANWPVRHIPVGLIVVMIILAPLLIAILGPDLSPDLRGRRPTRVRLGNLSCYEVCAILNGGREFTCGRSVTLGF